MYGNHHVYILTTLAICLYTDYFGHLCDTDIHVYIKKKCVDKKKVYVYIPTANLIYVYILTVVLVVIT